VRRRELGDKEPSEGVEDDEDIVDIEDMDISDPRLDPDALIDSDGEDGGGWGDAFSSSDDGDEALHADTHSNAQPTHSPFYLFPLDRTPTHFPTSSL